MKRLRVSPFFILYFAALLALGQAKEAIALFLALSIHETGHIIVARAQGCKVEKLALEPLGGYLHLDQLLALQPAAECRIALAGPAFNLLTAAVAMALTPYSPQGFVSGFIRASLTLMAFNLLPALPLDGGRVLRSRLTPWLSYYRATKIVIGGSFGCAFLLLILALVQASRGRFIPSLFAAAVFLLYNAWVERKQLLVPLLRYVLARQTSLRGTKLMAADTLVAFPDTKINEVLKHIRPQKYYQISVLNEEHAIAGILTEHELLRQILAGKGQGQLAEALKGRKG